MPTCSTVTAAAPAGVPSAAAPDAQRSGWVPPLALGTAEYETWNRLADLMSYCAVDTTVTSDMPAHVWAARLIEEDALFYRGEGRWPQGRNAPPPGAHLSVMAVETGLALPDFFAVSPAMDRNGSHRPNWTVHGLMDAAIDLYPGCSLRSMVGWLAAGMATSNPDTGGHALYRAWTHAGFTPDAWVFAAAGLNPDEARVGLVAGSLDRDQAKVMAVLRGVVLPVE